MTTTINECIEPRLPPDLERTIFEFAALGEQRVDTVNLLLVARRVYEWIRPTLYHVLLLNQMRNSDFINELRPGDDPFFPGSQSRLSDVGRYVHRLFLHLVMSSPETLQILWTIIPHCPNLRELVMWFTAVTSWESPLIDSRSGLRMLAGLQGLERLTCARLELPLDPEDCEILMKFKTLTHYSTSLHRGNTWSSLAYASYFPRLTHLRLHYTCADLELLKNVLRRENVGSLRVLVVEMHSRQDPYSFHHVDVDEVCRCVEDRYIAIKDHRLVIVDFEQLDPSTNEERQKTPGSMSIYADAIWTAAERIVEARTKGFFKEGLGSQKILAGYMDMDWEDDLLTDEGKIWFRTLPLLEFTKSIDVSH